MLISPLFLQNLVTGFAWLGTVGVLLLLVVVLLLAVFAYASALSVRLWNSGNPPVPSPRAGL